ESLRRAEVEPRLDDRAEHVEPADVEPPLAGPSVLLAEHRARIAPRVRPPALPRSGVDVAGDVPARAVERCDGGRRRVEEVDVVEIGVDGLVERPRELHLER